MYANEPVLIPDVPGKISFKKKKGSEYVQYETDRKYNPDRKYNLPDRKIIGIRIPAIPEMMLPNENYRKYFSEGEEKMSNSQKETAAQYAADKKQFTILRDLFDQLYYEFQMQSRRKPDETLNPYKAMKINSILEPLRKMMAGEEYASYLDLVDITQEEGEEKSISCMPSGGIWDKIKGKKGFYFAAFKFIFCSNNFLDLIIPERVLFRLYISVNSD